MRLLVAIAVTLVACRTGDAPGGVAVAPGGAASVSAAAPTPPRCTPSLPEPRPGGPAVEGPAYVVVDGVGVLRIAEGRVSIVLPRADASSWNPEVALGPTGELWLSDWDGITVIAAADREIRKRRLDRDGTRPERMTVLAARDVWAVTSDNEWDLVRFDGRQWATVRRRAQFPGKFDDNELEALAVTSDGVWVSTWNGLWRGVGDDWRRIDPPEGVEAFAELWVYRDQLIAGYVGGHFLRDGETWRALDWPVDASVRRAVGDVGLVVAPHLDGPTVLIGAVEGGGCIATSDPVHGSHVYALTIDGAGRVWVATEEALAVLDGSGRILTEWTAGTLEGLTGRIHAVVVVGAGPKQLPAGRPARMWEIVGRLETHKGSTPLANTSIELCSALSAPDQCAQTSFRRATTTRADGSFRFADVPEGELHMVVHPPADLDDCSGIFSESGHTIAPARDCHGSADAPLRCDLGTLTECLPFEMPPPH